MLERLPPIRVLQLASRPIDFQTTRALEALCRPGAMNAEVTRLEIGRGGRWRHAAGAAIGLRKIVSGFDIIQCWNLPLLTAAALAGGRRFIFSPQSWLSGQSMRWLLSVMHFRDVQVVCPSTTMRKALVRRGVPIERCHLIRPGVDFARVKRRGDQVLRQALGLLPEDIAILVPGEATEASDHFRAGWAISILHVLDERFRFLIWGRGHRADYVARLARKMDQPRLICVAEEMLGRPVDFEALLAAADFAMVSATGPAAVLPIADCMAAALPIVSIVTPTLSELLEDRHTALMVGDSKPRYLAAKLLALHEDPNLAASLADTARTEAFEYWSLTKFNEGWRRLYAQVAAGGEVEIER